MRIMCLGYGGSAAYWHQTLLHEGRKVCCAATVRNPEKQAALCAKGIAAHLWHEDGLDDKGIQALKTAEYVLISAAPSTEGDPIFATIAPILLASTSLQWLGYFSSTNVYGNHHGAWVDEETPCNPTGLRGVARVKAEQQWRDSGLPAHVFRLAGIYGPKRNQLRKLSAGKARRLIKEGHVFNRIHEADIAQTLNRSIAKPHHGRVYNLADDFPAPPQEVLAYAASLLNCPLPEAEDYANAELKGLAAEFYWDNKRVLNTRIKTELGVSLRYPDYRVGLDALYHLSSSALSSTV